MAKFSPNTKEELQSAVDLWCENEPEALKTYGIINNWDVSKITDMNSLFENKRGFNSDISNWNVSNVNNMCYMFAHAREFNQNISLWDVYNVTNMSFMFTGSDFDLDISCWDVSNVNTYDYMFIFSGIKEEYKPKFK
jgi:surface protein